MTPEEYRRECEAQRHLPCGFDDWLTSNPLPDFQSIAEQWQGVVISVSHHTTGCKEGNT
jgi:hypothetical protein